MDRRAGARGSRSTGSPPARRSLTTTLPVALLLILALASILRVAGLGKQSLWYDEGVSAYLATLPLSDLTAWTAGDIQPPLYYYLLWGWARIFGYSESALRGLSLLFSLLTVPLGWYAGRRFFSKRAGMLAGLIFATSPLYIWYAQEARNYALLTLLGLLSSLLLFHIVERLTDELRATEQKSAGVSWWIWTAYVLVNCAALYTHYFAAFLLVFHALHGAIIWLNARESTRSLWKLIVAWLLIGATYLPWIPHMIRRFGEDESYWQGALKIGEALRKLLISFSLGETVLEPVGYPLAIGFLVLLGFCLITLLWPAGQVRIATGAKERARPVLFLILYLFVPIAGILLLAIWTPKFNPRYLMLASPAYFLLFAGGVDALVMAALTSQRASRRMVQLALAGVAMGFLFGSFFYSDHNLYVDPAFTKADFRGVAEHLRAHKAPDEAVILLSGHMFPVFDYYMSEANAVRLPADRTLSTEHVLGYEIADTLNERLAGKSGVWVVRWQDEVVDPNGMVAMLLETAGGQAAVAASFWHVGLDHYRLPADARFSDSPDIAHRDEANFGDLIRLLGWSQPIADEYMLYWQAIQPIEDDLAVSLRLVDEQGLWWGHDDRRPAAYLYPTTRWKPGEILSGAGALPALAGAPPGEYWLEVQAYVSGEANGLDILDAAGAPQGRVMHIGPFQLERAGFTLEADSISLTHVLDYVWRDQIALRGAGALPDTLAVGDATVLELSWHALAPADVSLSAQIRLHSLTQSEARLIWPLSLFDAYPSHQWRAGEWLRGKDRIWLPASWPAGPTRVELVVSDSSGALDPVVDLGTVIVAAPERTFDVPADIQLRSGARAGDLVRLLGLTFEPAVPPPGEYFLVTLYWQPLRETDRSYSVFVHVLDAGGQIAAQYDRIPADGARPTTGWVAGEVIADQYVFEKVPEEGASLAIGLFDAGSAGMPRLEWRSATDVAIGDALFWAIPVVE